MLLVCKKKMSGRGRGLRMTQFRPAWCCLDIKNLLDLFQFFSTFQDSPSPFIMWIFSSRHLRHSIATIFNENEPLFQDVHFFVCLHPLFLGLCSEKLYILIFTPTATHNSKTQNLLIFLQCSNSFPIYVGLFRCVYRLQFAQNRRFRI